MTKEDKDLLFKEICARLPYGILAECGTDYDFQNNITETVKLLSLDIDIEICRIKVGNYLFNISLDEIKPYLRPMSSMTEEERLDLSKLTNEQFKFYLYTNIPQILCCGGSQYNYLDGLSIIDWLNAHHFDYRGLIEKGLALEAPEDMYKN